MTTKRRSDANGFSRDYTVVGRNDRGDSLSLRPEHLTDYGLFCGEGWEVGPFTASEMLAYVREVGRVGIRTDDNGALHIEPVHTYVAYLYTGHPFEYPAPKTSAHSTCTHPPTKAARAACRRVFAPAAIEEN